MKGITSIEVLELQKYLNQLDYNLDENGTFGENTYYAVMSFQQNNPPLIVNGIYNDDTQEILMRKTHANKPPASQILLSLGANDITPGIEAKNMKVATLQVELNILKKLNVFRFGYEKVVDGIFDTDTKDMLQKFQQSELIADHGCLDALTQSHIDKCLGIHKPKIAHQAVTLVTQSSEFHCWAACIAMLKGWNEDANLDTIPGQTHHHRAISEMRQHLPSQIVSSEEIRKDSLSPTVIDGIHSWNGYGLAKQNSIIINVAHPIVYQYEVAKDFISPGSVIDRKTNDMPVVGPKIASLFSIKYLGLGVEWDKFSYYRELRKSPIIINRINRKLYEDDRKQNSHYVVVAGIIMADLDDDTNILIYNPWPTNEEFGFDHFSGKIRGKGSIKYMNFYDFKENFAAYGIFSR